MKYSKYSAVIVGSGVAGLFCALKIAQNIALPDGLLVITKSNFGESNSRYAQGGIVGVMKSNTEDSVELHTADTIKAGAGLSDIEVVKFISENSDTVINDLIGFGVEFDRDEDGNLTYTLEAAHSVRRILHAGGDATGSVIEKTGKSTGSAEIYPCGWHERKGFCLCHDRTDPAVRRFSDGIVYFSCDRGLQRAVSDQRRDDLQGGVCETG